MEEQAFAGYFKKRSAEELLEMLAFCMRKNNYEQYSYLIGTILEEANRCYDPEDTCANALWVRELMRRYKEESER